MPRGGLVAHALDGVLHRFGAGVAAGGKNATVTACDASGICALARLPRRLEVSHISPAWSTHGAFTVSLLTYVLLTSQWLLLERYQSLPDLSLNLSGASQTRILA